MIRLTDEEKGTVLGSVTEEQFQVVLNDLEEESAEDVNYWVDEATLEMLEEDGADAALVEMLRKALGEREGFEVRWERV
jgi:processive 1,2-diacylglycerol beta-glucosyltransferase